MNTKIAFALCAAALLLPAETFLHAAEPTATTGHVLILENARILEGDIERVGAQYRVRRTIGETWIPADRAQALCANLEEAYAVLRGQANLRDADEHMRLARWCQLHGLRAQAVAEAAEAVAIRPDHEENRRFLSGLQRCEASATPAKMHEETEPESAPQASVDFNADSLGMFVTRVQPVLMNACASCHANGRGGSFKLARTYEGQLTNRKATQQNLTAVLSQVNRDRPQTSSLLLRAVTVHGEIEQPPIKSRQTPAYRILEDWVQLALANVPAHESVSAALPPPPPETKNAFEAVPIKASAAPPSPVSAPPPAAALAAPAPAPPTPPPPAQTPATPPAGPSDPFDPMIFNRQVHGERSPTQEQK